MDGQNVFIIGKGVEALIKQHTEKTGETTDAFMVRAILETIGRDKKKEVR